MVGHRWGSGAGARLAGLLVVTGLLVAGCGSSSSGTAASSSSSVSVASAASSTAMASGGAAGSAGSSQSGGSSTGGSGSSAAGTVTVATTNGALGVYLVDGAGRTLYMFDSDTAGTSACYDGCATAWPPLTSTAAAAAGGSAAAAKLSTITRTDGSKQVVYGQHPLYYFAADTAAGQVTGQGTAGKWWVVGPDGQPITAAAASSAMTSGTG